MLDSIENHILANERHCGRKAVALEKTEDRLAAGDSGNVGGEEGAIAVDLNENPHPAIDAIAWRGSHVDRWSGDGAGNGARRGEGDVEVEATQIVRRNPLGQSAIIEVERHRKQEAVMLERSGVRRMREGLEKEELPALQPRAKLADPTELPEQPNADGFEGKQAAVDVHRVDGILKELHGPLRILRGDLVIRPWVSGCHG
jgi:hypothetical protein